MLGVTGMSSLNGPMTARSGRHRRPSSRSCWRSPVGLFHRDPPALLALPLWKAGVLYVVAATASYQLTFWLMYAVGYGVAKALITSGVLQT